MTITNDLLNDFQKLDQLEYENGVESVFAVQYSMDDETDGAGNINWSNLLNAPKGPYGGDGFFLPSQNLINAYKTDTYGLPLFDTFNTDDYGIYEGSELTNVDATVDPRLDFVTGRPGITWKTYTVEPCKANWVRNSGEYGFNCTKRFYISPESDEMFQGWPWGASHLNWQIIRYADVLLMYAEAVWRAHEVPSPEALEYVNQVRRRGFGVDIKTPNEAVDLKMMDGDKFAEALLAERSFELCFEGQRWYDLVRFGKLEEGVKKLAKYSSVATSQAQNFQPKHVIFPIPQDVIDASNGKIEQNPLWK